MVYGALYEGFFVSDDRGRTWTKTNIGWSSRSRVTDLVLYGSDLFAATGQGVFMSPDDGTSWTAANWGLPRGKDFVILSVSGSYLFGGTRGGEVWRLPLSEASLRR
jgi:hypothetical protein